MEGELVAIFLYHKVTSMGPELQSQNRVELCYGKTVSLGTWLAKALCKSNISLCLSQNKKSLAPKLTEWWPFKPYIFKWVLPAKFLSHTLYI